MLRTELLNSNNTAAKNTADSIASLRSELTNSTQNAVKNMGDMIATNQQGFSTAQSEKLSHFEDRLKTFSLENEQKLSWILIALIIFGIVDKIMAVPTSVLTVLIYRLASLPFLPFV